MKISDKNFERFVRDSRSVRQVLQKMGLKPAGGNYKTVKMRIEKLGLDKSHFLGAGWNLNGHQDWNKKPLESILIKNSSYTNVNCLRKRLISEGFFEKRCNNCKKTRWMGESISLELEHKNGIVNDHRIENLELLCPNCHSLTKTYRGKNIGKNK